MHVGIGQAVLALEEVLEYSRDTVFNYPTLAEASQGRRPGWAQ